ncbi:MAG: ECF transporter S component [Bacilli bacterium]
MKNKVIREMTLSAAIIAIIAIMSYVPYVGYITIAGIASICTIHIVVLVCALLFGWKQGLVAGIAFGLFSLLKALTMPASSIDFAFVNPLISILPRAIFGLVAGLLFSLIKKMPSVSWRTVLYVCASIILTIFHSFLVLLMLWFFRQSLAFNNNFMNVLSAIIAVNALIELIAAGILVPMIAWPLSKAFPQYNPYYKKTSKTINDLYIKKEQ